MKAIHFFIVFLILGSALSCGNLKGEFAFKTLGDKGFKIIHGKIEFDAQSDVSWLYRFDNVGSRVNLGVVILKKELQWVDIFTRGEYVDNSKKFIYGDLKGLEPGDYKIVIFEVLDKGDNIIDECFIHIYSDAEVFD